MLDPSAPHPSSSSRRPRPGPSSNQPPKRTQVTPGIPPTPNAPNLLLRLSPLPTFPSLHPFPLAHCTHLEYTRAAVSQTRSQDPMLTRLLRLLAPLAPAATRARPPSCVRAGFKPASSARSADPHPRHAFVLTVPGAPQLPPHNLNLPRQPAQKTRPKLSLASPPPLGAGWREIAPPSPPPNPHHPAQPHPPVPPPGPPLAGPAPAPPRISRKPPRRTSRVS